jgi:hypothetical protein
MAVVVAKGSAAGIMKPATSYTCPRLARRWATGAPAELADGPLRRRDHGHDYAARQATTNCHRTSPVRATDGRRKMNGAAHASTTDRKLRRRRCTQASAPSQPRTPRAGGRTGAGPGRNRRGAARNHGGRAHRGRGLPQVRRRTMKRRLKRRRGSQDRRARRQERAAGERVETPRSRPALTAMLLAAAATTRVAWPKNEGVQEGPAEGLEPRDARVGAHGEPPRGLHDPRKHTHTQFSQTDHTNHRTAVIAVVGPVVMLMGDGPTLRRERIRVCLSLSSGRRK